jgi:hypothetical protein
MRIANSDKSLIGLIGQLPEQAKAFLKEEVELAKKEISEKIARTARNAVLLVVGGFIAYAGSLLLLAALGFLVGRLYQQNGLEAFMAACAGVGTVGLLVLIIGGIAVLKGMKTLSRESIAPEKTIETLKGSSDVSRERDIAYGEREPQSSSEEIQDTALASKNEIKETVEEIGERLRPHYMMTQLKRSVREHPLEWTMASMVTAAIGGVLLKRKRVPFSGRT